MSAHTDAGLRRALEAVDLEALAAPLIERAGRACQTNPHGDRAKWQRVLDQLADIAPSSCDFTQSAIQIGAPQDCDRECKARLKHLLLELKPWRKGPFNLFGVMIDSEWRANLKWDRLAAQIDLRGRRALDVGCGNGYYLWRMLGHGARIALGIDPAQLYIAQFNALKRYCPDRPAFVLPLKSEQFPLHCGNNHDDIGFDSVFSMGVLYHRRHPREHLRKLLAFARPGGEIIVETLTLDGDADAVLTPAGRYAKMRNVHAIPSPLALEAWLRQSGATGIRLLDVSTTTAAEQRATEWMEYESLDDFLDPSDRRKTIEGHPAPRRAIFLCRKPE